MYKLQYTPSAARMDDEVGLSEVNLVQSHTDKVVWLMEMAACTLDLAERALDMTSGDMTAAIDVILAMDSTEILGPVSGSGRVGASTSSEDEVRRLMELADARTRGSC